MKPATQLCIGALQQPEYVTVCNALQRFKLLPKWWPQTAAISISAPLFLTCSCAASINCMSSRGRVMAAMARISNPMFPPSIPLSEASNA